ncbi:MAG: hypothetical protein KDA63_12935, partial [Planctomycetales bacterium]|nr:hypothetical protein [Planctomycetales bacterium]
MSTPQAAPSNLFRSELALWAGAATTVAFYAFGGDWLADLHGVARSLLLFAWLFAVMLWLSFSVVRHADCLAVKLGEPYGTLILTLSVISIEVTMISAVMLTGENNPYLARDTMFAVLMIVLGGMVGLTLLVGGIRHHEQSYNLAGANSFLSVIIPMAVLGLVLPRFTESTPDASASLSLTVFLITASFVLYSVFLGLQTMRHRAYFIQPGDGDAGNSAPADHHEGLVVGSVGRHATLLVASMLPIVLLSKKMAKLIDHGIEVAGAPAALGGFFVALLVLSPEGLGAIRAALDNQLQRAVNICLGSALAT